MKDMKAKMQDKVHKVMREYKAGKLKSSSGDKVASREQAVAIAMSEADKLKKGKCQTISTCINSNKFFWSNVSHHSLLTLSTLLML